MEPDLVLFDGDCALCRRSVRFALVRDPDGSRFRFAPLGGSTARERLAPETLAALPDSLVVLRADGRLLLRSDAALRVLERCGGAWRALARAAALVPRPLRDALYDAVARRRHRLARRRGAVCPLPDDGHRGRFLP
ncbi:MAG: DUF393 domain-containing protein [Acidobacteria bacterium]|nr:MAG: DUF393 domain-containing protein [Acidobacteriota bacterium]